MPTYAGHETCTRILGTGRDVAQRLRYGICSRGERSSLHSTFPYRGKLLHRETSAAFPSPSGPLFPPGSGTAPTSLIVSIASIKVREGKGEFLWI